MHKLHLTNQSFVESAISPNNQLLELNTTFGTVFIQPLFIRTAVKPSQRILRLRM